MSDEQARRFGLGEVVGIELEYMIVREGTLAVLPVADRVLAAAEADADPARGEPAAANPGAPPPNELEIGALAWSNELCLHVIELKTAEPIAPSRIASMLPAFDGAVGRIGALLAPLGGRLLPGGMHPFMDPDHETRLWPHDSHDIYRAFDRVFGCRGHGWANLQSMHLNLPFADDDEFARLHAAIRVVLPILPALAASSPVADGRRSASLDERLEVYRTNARRVASVMGRIIPEPAFSERAYRERILEPMYRDMAPHDPGGILRHEWLNSRGAIARFSRGSVEVRILDVQECPAADLAIADLVTRTIDALACGRLADPAEQQRWEIEPLERIFLRTIREAEQAEIDDPAYLRMFGVKAPSARAGEVWAALAEGLLSEPAGEAERRTRAALRVLLERGPLARRVSRALGDPPAGTALPRERLVEVWDALARCLADGRSFEEEP